MANNFRITGGIYCSKAGNDANAGTNASLPKLTPEGVRLAGGFNAARVIGSGTYYTTFAGSLASAGSNHEWIGDGNVFFAGQNDTLNITAPSANLIHDFTNITFVGYSRINIAINLGSTSRIRFTNCRFVNYNRRMEVNCILGTELNTFISFENCLFENCDAFLTSSANPININQTQVRANRCLFINSMFPAAGVFTNNHVDTRSRIHIFPNTNFDFNNIHGGVPGGPTIQGYGANAFISPAINIATPITTTSNTIVMSSDISGFVTLGSAIYRSVGGVAQSYVGRVIGISGGGTVLTLSRTALITSSAGVPIFISNPHSQANLLAQNINVNGLDADPQFVDFNLRAYSYRRTSPNIGRGDNGVNIGGRSQGFAITTANADFNNLGVFADKTIFDAINGSSSLLSPSLFAASPVNAQFGNYNVVNAHGQVITVPQLLALNGTSGSVITRVYDIGRPTTLSTIRPLARLDFNDSAGTNTSPDYDPGTPSALLTPSAGYLDQEPANANVPTSIKGNNITINLTTSSGLSTATMVDTSLVFVGMLIRSANVPAGTTVSSIDSDTQITMSLNATATGTLQTTFSNIEGRDNPVRLALEMRCSLTPFTRDELSSNPLNFQTWNGSTNWVSMEWNTPVRTSGTLGASSLVGTGNGINPDNTSTSNTTLFTGPGNQITTRYIQFRIVVRNNNVLSL